jgi:hypothetical protein
MRIAGIVNFWKRCNGKASYSYRFKRIKSPEILLLNAKAALLMRIGGDINRNLIFFYNRTQSLDVVTMFMGYKNRFYFRRT